MADGELPTVDDVFAIHEDIVEQYDLPPGTGRPFPRIPIESAIDDARERDDHFWRAATLLRGIANAHVFEDGNKRTAYTTARTYLSRVGKEIAPSKAQRAVVMQHFTRFDASELATWLETGDIDEDRLREPYPD
ncbi:MAG: Fic family protein [Halobacteriales archaeon]